MPHSSSFHFRKTKNMPRDYSERKPTGYRRFRDVSHMKLTDIFKSLQRRRPRRVLSRSSSLTHSQSFPPPVADHDTSPAPPPSSDLFTFPSLHISRYRSDAVSILSVTEEDCSSGMSTSSCGPEGTSPDVKRGCHCSPCRVPAFPTSPSMFQLRSTTREDYLVERLEQHLRQLSLGDASSDHGPLSETLPRDIPMDVCLDGSPQRPIVRDATSSRRAPSDRDAQKPKPKPPSHNQNVPPMILITSVNAKHAKPLPPSADRPSTGGRAPFSSTNLVNRTATNVPSTKSKRKPPPDDPFMTQPGPHNAPPDMNLTFRLPAFPPAQESPTKYAPETPTPMCCDHFGDCGGDLWEILHPPLVAGQFTLPPFTLPPLSEGLFR